MNVVLIQPYLIAIAGLAAGAAMGMVAAALKNHRLSAWDAWLTVPLLLAAAGAHIALIPRVELERQILFGLYGAGVAGTVIFAMAGLGIWRLGAILLPLGSVGGYFFFAMQVHQADYVGLLVKLVELAAVVAALVPVMRHQTVGARRVAA